MQCLIIKKCQQSALSSYTSAFPGFMKMSVPGIMIIIKRITEVYSTNILYLFHIFIFFTMDSILWGT